MTSVLRLALLAGFALASVCLHGQPSQTATSHPDSDELLELWRAKLLTKGSGTIRITGPYGPIFLSAVIDADGRVSDAQLLQALGAEREPVNTRAIETVREARYTPGLRNGVPATGVTVRVESRKQ